MSINNDNVCRLCIKVTGNEFVVIEETFKEIFNFLLLQIDLDVSYNPVICRNCAEAVQKCFYFKSRCIDTEELILSVVIEKRRAGFELKDIHEDKDVGYITEYFNVCRFCMNRLGTNNFISLDDLSKKVAFVEALMPLYMSDLDMDIVKDPVICTTCKEKLEYYLKFAKHCLNVEEKISAYCRDKGTNSTGQVRLSSAMLKYNPKRSEESTKILKRETNTFENKICNKLLEMVEPLHVKDDILNCPEESTELAIKKDISEFECIKNERQDELIKKILDNKSDDSISDDSNIALTIDNDDDESEVELKDISRATKRNIYKCTMCYFESRYICGIWSHILNHDGNQSEPQKTYKCATCTYETKDKSDLKSHNLTHKNKPRVETYKCQMCWYETKNKSHLNRHILKHKDKTEVEIYKCATCAYETKYKCHLKSHITTHKNTSRAEMYECERCSYQTRYKRRLKAHIVSHDNAELDKYKCAECGYETNYRNRLQAHILSHVKSELEMYRCGTCSFETRYKCSLRSHNLSHRNKCEVETYKCETCFFETRYKCSLRSHMLRHKDKNRIEI